MIVKGAQAATIARLLNKADREGFGSIRFEKHDHNYPHDAIVLYANGRKWAVVSAGGSILEHVFS